jgi:hypothetical protein
MGMGIVAQSPERMAWVTLLVSQLLCILLTAGSFGVGWWYTFVSTTSLHAEVQVGRGTVGVLTNGSNTEQAERFRRSISDGAVLSTDADGQGTILFSAGGGGDVLASVTLTARSQVRLVSSERPRFDLNEAGYGLVLDSIEGRIEVDIAPGINSPFEIIATGTHGEVRLREAGTYIISATPEITRLYARDHAAVMLPIGGEAATVPSGYTGTVNEGRMGTLLDLRQQELVRADFRDSNHDNLPDGGVWGCSTTSDEPLPSYNMREIDGQNSMFIVRQGPQPQPLGPSETACSLRWSDAGLDMTPYRDVRVRVELKILDQSLTLCGVEASECPLMIELTYITVNGVSQQRWYQGFYAIQYPGQPVNRTTCASCLSEHIQVKQDNWFTYESTNLLELPVDFIPAQLQQIKFYASGHAYEVAISEVSIIGELEDAVQ